jgi:hypothetical protein
LERTAFHEEKVPMSKNGASAANVMTVISGDSHVLEPFDLWSRALGSRYGDSVPHIVPAPPGGSGAYLFCGKETVQVEELVSADNDERLSSLIQAGYDPAARETLLDKDGVTAEVLNSTWMLYAMRIENPDVRRACCEVFNDWLAEYCSHNPKSSAWGWCRSTT